MFEVGQRVWDILHGEGTVLRADGTYTYPVCVKFANGVEYTYTLDGKYTAEHALPSLHPYPVEIVKKVTKPSINWEHVRGEYKFLAQDASGKAWLYREEPAQREDLFWNTKQGACAEANSYASYTPGTCDWKDSLVARPKDT